ncbi:hypothetical protein T01_7837 [Trichinella spiralis]|uniref:Uncharacterized protein n=1 Tax=Trichinella spiralis TaxID=6334 RepID=A0A0V0YVE7_TRISP|nr:hypothetical protein T01_7837 [Trichinella spiralis]
MLWFVHAIVSRTVRNRMGYAVLYDALVILRSGVGAWIYDQDTKH